MASPEQEQAEDRRGDKPRDFSEVLNWFLRRFLKYGGGALVTIGFLGIIIGPIFGDDFDMSLWLVEPLVALGGILVISGLLLILMGQVNGRWRRPTLDEAADVTRWVDLTQQYFDTFGHDLGRPLRRILGKQRELRTRLEASGRTTDADVLALLDEIEQQAPNFRLMMSNIQVLVELEDATSSPEVYPVAPAHIVRNIANRYSAIARDQGVEVAWWSEPEEFGVEHSAGGAIDHIVTNLVDNAVRFAEKKVEIRLTRNRSHFFVRVWDDGSGIEEQFLPHVFDRGWTPEVAGQEERTTSGLGLHIARTLALRSNGELSVESISTPSEGHHTAFLLMLPRLDSKPVEKAPAE